MPQKVAFVSLGCAKNLVDSERMLGLLAQDGMVLTDDHSQADAIVINTCGFLEASRTEALKEIRAAVKMKTQGRCRRVVVAGCLVQRHKTKLLADEPGIDRLVGVFDRENIVKAVRAKSGRADKHFVGKYHDLSAPAAAALGDDTARLRLTPRHWAYLRISEGCNQGCTFCTIPSIRGAMRSKSIEQIVAEARELAGDGAVELNLIGQDTTSYGYDIGYAPGLAGLVRALDKQLSDIPWLRLMYAYPSCFTDEMIRTIADASRFVKYIDIPLQHINDEVLTRMRRRVTRQGIETLLGKLRDWIPGLAIRTTFIAGSPGETDAQHRELVKFVSEFGFEMMGVFPYSREDGTAMGRMEDQISAQVKTQRVEELMLAQQKVAFAKARKMVGKTLPVLIDAPGAKGWVGRTPFQAPQIDSVTYVNADDLHPGQIIQATVSDYQAYDLVANVATEAPKPKRRALAVVEAHAKT